uniref:Uncharacterized protein n=1 Tax=Cacopsylla melanoneura TaxID=428564 RepID=A0A8D8ZGA8_9HEMI
MIWQSDRYSGDCSHIMLWEQGGASQVSIVIEETLRLLLEIVVISCYGSKVEHHRSVECSCAVSATTRMERSIWMIWRPSSVRQTTSTVPARVWCVWRIHTTTVGVLYCPYTGSESSRTVVSSRTFQFTWTGPVCSMLLSIWASPCRKFWPVLIL